MKKILSLLLIGIMALTMTFGLSGCGGPSQEQISKIEGLFTKYDAAIQSCYAEAAKFPKADNAEYTQNLETINSSIKQLKDLSAESKKAFDENKKDYDDEDIDDLVKTINEQIIQCETFKQTIIDNVKSTKAILDAQKGEGDGK